MIVVNQIRCNKCGDEPFSKSVHDFVWCECGTVAVDGGQEYLRRVGNTAQATELSFSLPDEVVNACRDAVTLAKNTNRNDLGIALAVIRALKGHLTLDLNNAT